MPLDEQHACVPLQIHFDSALPLAATTSPALPSRTPQNNIGYHDRIPGTLPIGCYTSHIQKSVQSVLRLPPYIRQNNWTATSSLYDTTIASSSTMSGDPRLRLGSLSLRLLQSLKLKNLSQYINSICNRRRRLTSALTAGYLRIYIATNSYATLFAVC
jgi:hypothetical protein